MSRMTTRSTALTQPDVENVQRTGRNGSVTLHYPMLTKTNYAVWAIKMRVNLQAQGVWDAIQNAEVEEQKDQMALAAIYQAIPEDVLLMLAEKDTAKEAWEMLKTMYMGANRLKEAKVQTLRSDFEVIRMKNGETIDDFVMRLNTIVTGIRSLGEKIEESTVVKKFLRAVPMKFIQIVTSIEQFGDLKNMTVEEVVGRLKTHEERLRGYEEREEGPSLLLTHAEWASRSKQTNEGEDRGRGQGGGRGRGDGLESKGNRNDYNPRRKDKSKIKCFTCEKFGHYASKCPNKKQDEEVNLIQTDEDEDPVLMMAISHEDKSGKVSLKENSDVNLLASEESHVESEVWYLDNGASNHMTGDRSKFHELDESVTGHTRFGNGSKIDIKGKCVILVDCGNGDQKELNEVYYIPRLKSNVISLGQLTENGNQVLMNNDILRVFDYKNTLFLEAKRSRKRLYKTFLKTRRKTCFFSSREDFGWLWHQRLRYANFYTIKNFVFLENYKFADSYLKRLDNPNKQMVNIDIEKCEKGHRFFDERKRKPRMNRGMFF